jgi:hypothetical protein
VDPIIYTILLKKPAFTCKILLDQFTLLTNFLFHAKDEEKKIEEDFKQLHNIGCQPN